MEKKTNRISDAIPQRPASFDDAVERTLREVCGKAEKNASVRTWSSEENTDRRSRRSASFRRAGLVAAAAALVLCTVAVGTLVTLNAKQLQILPAAATAADETDRQTASSLQPTPDIAETDVHGTTPDETPEPTGITVLPCSTPFFYDVFCDENGEHTRTEAVLFTCDFDGDGTAETLSCRNDDGSYTFLLDGEAFLTLDSVTYVTAIDLDPSTPYLNLIFACDRTSEESAKSFEMHPVNGAFVRGATVAASLRWDGEALRGGSIQTDLLGTKYGSRIYDGEDLMPQADWFDCEIIPTEEELENNRDELMQRGILLQTQRDLKGTVSGEQPTVIPKGTYLYMTRWHESNTIVKVVTEDGKAVYLSTKILGSEEAEKYVRDVVSQNADYDPAKYYSGNLINGLPQEMYFDNLFYSD